MIGKIANWDKMDKIENWDKIENRDKIENWDQIENWDNMENWDTFCYKSQIIWENLQPFKRPSL